MRVVHLATSDTGGAAKGLLNLHQSLLSIGVESSILVANKTSNIDSVFVQEPNQNLFCWSRFSLVRRLQKIARRRGKLQTIVERCNNRIEKIVVPGEKACFTSPYSIYDLVQHPLVQAADIVHIHWVGNYIDYPTFFSAIKKPIVWTLRDENPGLGGFHYETDKARLGEYYAEIEEEFRVLKRSILRERRNITLVALSDHMREFCASVDFLCNKDIEKIYNPVSPFDYMPIERRTAKKALQLDVDTLTISFISVSLCDHRKGLYNLLAALDCIGQPYRLLCVGNNDYAFTSTENITCYGNISNEALLSLIYSASDVFVTPSEQESFGKTVIEAMLCGTPVISTKVGVAPEIIDESCGILINDSQPESIALAIKQVSNSSYDHDYIRDKAKQQFDPKKIAQKHLELYRRVANSNSQAQ